MKRLALVGALALITLLASASETTGETNADWKPLDLEAKSVSHLLETVNVDGPQVLTFEFTPYRSEGKLKGCGYAFNILMKDWAYRSNQPIIVYGSIVYFSHDGKAPYLSFRIGLKDVEERENKLWQRNASVNYAYLRFGDKSLAGKEDATTEGEDGVKVLAYVDSGEENLMAWLALPETLSVWFNRESKSTDLHFDLSVMDFKEAWLSQASCYRELAGFDK